MSCLTLINPLIKAALLSFKPLSKEGFTTENGGSNYFASVLFFDKSNNRDKLHVLIVTSVIFHTTIIRFFLANNKSNAYLSH